MFPPIFTLAAAHAPLTALLGVPPNMRFYPGGRAPQGVAYPYAVWQTAYGTPENYQDQPPDIDNLGAQVDVFGNTLDEARAVGKALCDALEGDAHVTAWRGEAEEPATKKGRVSFDVEFWTPR
jgi:hypothetical protein